MASDLFAAPSLVKIAERWSFTLHSRKVNCLAMSALVSPRTTDDRISFCLWVRSWTGGSSAMSCSISFDTALPPLATVRIEDTNSLKSVFFISAPESPAARAWAGKISFSLFKGVWGDFSLLWSEWMRSSAYSFLRLPPGSPIRAAL